jgi:hypothetical protein
VFLVAIKQYITRFNSTNIYPDIANQIFGHL